MTVIDVAGASSGGAARWRREASGWLERSSRSDVCLIGRDRHVEPGWLARREFARARRKIAANNVSFLFGVCRIVLLNNPLHFLLPSELGVVGLPVGFSRQIPIVRAATRRAKVVVVPSHSMSERVLRALPGLRSRLTVRHHPLSLGREKAQEADPFILFPSIPSPHKDLHRAIGMLSKALACSGVHWRIKLTAARSNLTTGVPENVDAVGAQGLDAMEALISRAAAIFAPYTTESFCYPIAEGRAMGVPVVAADSPLATEVGGAAVVTFDDTTKSLADAIRAASTMAVAPEPGPFDPDSYFGWLTSL